MLILLCSFSSSVFVVFNFFYLHWLIIGGPPRRGGRGGGRPG